MAATQHLSHLSPPVPPGLAVFGDGGERPPCCAAYDMPPLSVAANHRRAALKPPGVI